MPLIARKTTNAEVRIALLSPCGWGNLGDAAIIEAVIKNIRARCPLAQVIGATSNPCDTERRHGILTYPLAAKHHRVWEEPCEQLSSHSDICGIGTIKQQLWKSSVLKPALRFFRWVACFFANIRSESCHAFSCYRIAKNAKLIIVAGGGQLDEFWGGAWGHPFTLFKWTAIARIAGTPVVILSVGCGTLRSLCSRFFLRRVLSLAAYRSFRDKKTQTMANDILDCPTQPVVPDLAFSLPVSQPSYGEQLPSRRLVVGISPIAFCDTRSWPEKNDTLYCAYIAKLAEFVKWLADHGYQIVLFCTDNMDVHALRDMESLAGRRACLESDGDRPEPYYKGVGELLAQLARVDVVVASRLHGVILSHLIAKTTLALSYDWKVETHMMEFGEQENCLDINNFEVLQLIERFSRLNPIRSQIEEKIRSQVAGYVLRINKQYDETLNSVFASAVLAQSADET